METPPPSNKNLRHVINYVESHRGRQRKRYCGCLEIFHQFLSRTFHKFGYFVALRPSYFIIIPIFMSLLGITGIQQLDYQSDPEYLFAPKDGRGKYERETLEKHFPLDYTDNFTPDRITKISHFARLIVKAKDGGTMFRNEHWDELNLLDEAVWNFTIQWEKGIYSYKDVCAKRDDECLENHAIKLNEIIPEVANGSSFINYPIMLFPFVLPYIYGGPIINESEGILESAEAITLAYWLRENDSKEKERAHIWEGELLNLIQETEFEYIKVSIYVSRALEDELERNAFSVTPYLVINFLLMIFFSTLSVSRMDWVRGKTLLGIVAVLSSMFATITAFGFLMYCQVPFIGLNMAVPFLMLGIGLDDMFVVLSAWHRTKIQDDVTERLAACYAEAGVSITITSLTNMLSFFVGSFTPFPSVHIFCLYTGIAVLLTYLWFLTFFGGCLAIAGYYEQKQRHCVLQWKTVKAKSQTESCCYKFWCSGGINAEDPWNPKDNTDHPIMLFCRDYLGRALSIPAIKTFVICIFVLYLSGAIYGCMRIKEGLERRKLALDDSYLIDYFDDEDRLYRKFPYRIQVVIDDDIIYSNPETEEMIMNLHDIYENSTYIGEEMYSRSLIRAYYNYLSRRPQLKKNMTGEDDSAFIDILLNKFLRDGSDYWNDFALNENKTRILATRFIIQSHEVKDTNADKDMMIELRRIADESPLNVQVFHPYFVFFDQYLLVRETSIRSICSAAVVMIAVSILFIPSLRCAILVGFSIVSIEVGVIGYMSLWDVNLDSVSMINLIMCIGFSVDFSAHISYAFLASKGLTPNCKLRDCLYSLGLPVLQGGFSTVFGVIILYFAPSYIFQTFFKVVFLVILFGVMHAIFLLPVLLSIFESFSYDKKKNIIPISGPIIQATMTPPNKMVGPLTNQMVPATGEMVLGTEEIAPVTAEIDDSEKDLGIGSSGTSSQSSVKDEDTPIDTDLGVSSKELLRKLSTNSKGVSNEAFVDDEVEIEVERL